MSAQQDAQDQPPEDAAGDERREEAPLDELPPEERLFRQRHSAAHVLAEAVLKMFPDAKYAIGPPIANGFYYDFELPRPLTPEDLAKLERRMRRTVKRNVPIEGRWIPKDEARAIFADQPYKLELIDEIEDDTVGHFRHAGFDDLCRGGHTARTGQIGAFKLTHVAGAYWRGDERRPMLQRIYAALFPTQEELDAHLEAVAEAERRDHRRLGRELDLFHLDALAPGSPFFHPKGTRLYTGLIDYIRELYADYGYEEVLTPQVFNTELFKTSGHYDNYREDMFLWSDEDGQEHGLKPMNCPGHCVLFAHTRHSYRELPLRYAEFTRLHRNERSGVVQGLTRVRAFAQDDAHIYCTPEQLEGEIDGFFEMTQRVYRDLGLHDVDIYVSTRGDKYIGALDDWERATEQLIASVERAGYECKIHEGEAAFYGPKADFDFRDAIGRAWQLSTLQLDMAMPERFGLTYIAADGDEHQPMMLHRAILGSLERFLGVYIEHTGGHFPLWLAPVQATVIPIADRHLDYASAVAAALRSRRLRVEVDDGGDRMGAKIRKAQLQKVPYMLVVGDREAEARAVSLRHRALGDLGATPLDEVVERIALERDERALDPEPEPAPAD